MPKVEIVRLATKSKASVVDLNKSLADAAMAAVGPEQRNERPIYVRELAGAMVRGEWELSNDGMCFVGEPGDSDAKLSNARHRGRARQIAEDMAPGKVPVIPIWLMTNCPPESMAVMDLGRPRTLADVLAVSRGRTEGVPNKDLGAVVLNAWHQQHGTWINRTNTPTKAQLVAFEEQNLDLADTVSLAKKLQTELHGPLGGYAVGIWLMGRGDFAYRIDEYLEQVRFGDVPRTTAAYQVHQALVKADINKHTVNADQRRAWWFAGILIKGWQRHVKDQRGQIQLRMTRNDTFPEAP